jgi:tetratricopeptide (TPR) repeat protein
MMDRHDMKRRGSARWRLLAVALVLMAAAPVEPPSFQKQIARAATMLDGNQNAEALAILDGLLAKTELPIERGQIEGLRSFALARMERIPEARKAIETAVASAPEPSMLLLRQLFLLRAFGGDPPGAADTLQLIASTDAAALNTLPTEVVSEVLRSIRPDKNRTFETDYALVVGNWSPTDATVGDLDWIRLRLVKALVERDRADDAKKIVDTILNPVILVRLGIDRRFAALWPTIEARLGPGADIADAAYVAAAKARFDKAPSSLVARLGYAEALNIASREPEAMVVADVARTPAELAALADREVWLVNLHAALLGDAGQIDAALARLSALNATPVNGRNSLVATMINEALFAASVKRPEATLQAVERAEKTAGSSEFGRLFLASARACALQQLGRKAAAAAAAAPVIASPKGNPDANLAAMICLGRMDDAAATIIARLEDPELRSEMIFEMQPFLIRDTTKLRDAEQRAGLRALKARPDVKATYLKYGRDLPAAVAPPR